jgi:hypothetical protein
MNSPPTERPVPSFQYTRHLVEPVHAVPVLVQPERHKNRGQTLEVLLVHLAILGALWYVATRP